VAATCSSHFLAGLRWIWLGVAAVLAQIWAVYFVGTEGGQGLARRVLLPLTIALLLVVALRNLRLWGVRLMAIGFVLNLLVISLNGGLMPVGLDEIANANLLHRVEDVGLGEPVPGSKGVLMASRDARLWFLSDVIVFPPGIRGAKIVSVGDLAIGLGLVIAIVEAVTRPIASRRALPAP